MPRSSASCPARLRHDGIRALVVNAYHVKQVPGRKTDVSDAEWLASLARCGLLTRRSFVPPQKYRELRLVSRHRQKLTGVLSAQKNRLAPGARFAATQDPG